RTARRSPSIGDCDFLHQLLRHPEDRNTSRRNRNPLPGARAALPAGLALLHLEGPESASLYVLARDLSAANAVEQLIPGFGNVFLGETGPLRDFIDQICLRHRTLPRRPAPPRSCRQDGTNAAPVT